MSRNRRVGFRLYLITDRKAVRSGDLLAACDAALSTAREVAPPGVVALQLREKDLDARALYELACRLREITARAGAPLIINDRIDIAIASSADGVHLPFESIGATAARRLLGPDQLIGVSTHSVPDIVSAAREGVADFAVFGPVYEPLSKARYGAVHGPHGLFQACAAGAIPIYALGGITPARATELFANPESERLAGVATIGSMMGAESPAAAMRAMLAALNVARNP
ncbi:MAG: thiamine phosphate synthase [Candidatus Binataceae bacterium]